MTCKPHLLHVRVTTIWRCVFPFIGILSVNIPVDGKIDIKLLFPIYRLLAPDVRAEPGTPFIKRKSVTETLDGIVDRRIRMRLGNQSHRRNGIPVKEVNFQTNDNNDVNLPNTNKVDVNVRSDSEDGLKGAR